jgi:hypothetical protein
MLLKRGMIDNSGHSPQGLNFILRRISFIMRQLDL